MERAERRVGREQATHGGRRYAAQASALQHFGDRIRELRRVLQAHENRGNPSLGDRRIRLEIMELEDGLDRIVGTKARERHVR